MPILEKFALIALGLTVATSAYAGPFHSGERINELSVNAGGGKQPHADQNNRSYGIDYNFYRFKRSPRQHLLIGASYTHLSANHDNNSFDNSSYAISIYPQLNLYLDQKSWGQPYFFVRALGPSYLSDNRLGERQQAHNFTFQAQVGAGAYFNLGANTRGTATLSWKHFSNANLFSDNDGIDLPLMLNLGLEL